MKIFKKAILPIFWVLIFAAISTALVKIAFFPDTTSNAAPDLLEPGGQISAPLFTVESGTVINEIQLMGNVERDSNSSAQSTTSGTVTVVHAKEGATVKKGDSLLTIRQDYPRKTVLIKAPISGTLKNMSLIKGQNVSLGETVAEVTPTTFKVVAEVHPTQLYRLLNAPETAEIQIVDGPAPFTCTSLKVINGDTGSEVTCAIPHDVKVFAGLPTKMIIQSGISENTLVVPTTAVEGGSGSGNVWLVTADGKEEVRPVKLGMSDGFKVEVLEGLKSGDNILQFIPGGAGNPDGDEDCFLDSNGSMTCNAGMN